MIEFYKYQGTGNDFVMIDNRQSTFIKDTKQIAKLCDRRFGIGADGLILLENDKENHTDFKMIYYNSDGNIGSMCGNGGRCIVAFAKKLGIIKDQTTFIATDGKHSASIEGVLISLRMSDVDEIKSGDNYTFLNTGSPHHIILVEDVESIDVKKEGAKIRYGELYTKEGSNINFVTQLAENSFTIRTYERGVEDETLSCGTGAVAVAIAMNYLGKTTANEVSLKVMGGNLKVSFDKNERYSNIDLIGTADFVFKGSIEL
jgi:diaminopimelate epimerase